jgi:heme/copper-type cytochrome/quinol oxidase subunit 2
MRTRHARWSGLLAAVVLLTPPRAAAAGPPVHVVQIAAGRYQFEPAAIQVTAGESVRLVLRSKDGVHGFSIPSLEIDAQIPKGGDPVTVEFTAPAAGQYQIACSELCGSGHGRMKAVLVSAAKTTPAPR